MDNRNKNPPELLILEAVVKRALLDYRTALKKHNAEQIAELCEFWEWLKRPNALDLDGDKIKKIVERSLNNGECERG